MDLKREIKVGDDVLCIKESNVPYYVGQMWKVLDICDNVYYCVNYDLCIKEFIFRKDEIVISSSLIRELL
jgi:hypothetical protein